MRWKGRRQSTNVRDTRGQGGGGFRLPTGGRRTRRAGGGGIGFMIVAGIVMWMLGINPLTFLLGGGGGSLFPSGEGQQREAGVPRSSDEQTQFVKTILADTEETWTRIFASQGAQYKLPQLEIFSGRTRSACGNASAATGPFYCPLDSSVYIDLDFYDQLQRQLNAPGDFAQAYVLAHEVGHHVQNVIGVLPEFNRQRQQMSKVAANAMSVKVELQADCFAGIWARDVSNKGFLEDGDLEEALNAAQQIGDDTLMGRAGRVNTENFTHGSSEQRQRWFYRGYESANLNSCDTFNAPSL